MSPAKMTTAAFGRVTNFDARPGLVPHFSSPMDSDGSNPPESDYDSDYNASTEEDPDPFYNPFHLYAEALTSLADDPIRGSRGPVFTDMSRRPSDAIFYLPNGEVSHHGQTPPSRFWVLEHDQEPASSNPHMALRRSTRQATRRKSNRLLSKGRLKGRRTR